MIDPGLWKALKVMLGVLWWILFSNAAWSVPWLDKPPVPGLLLGAGWLAELLLLDWLEKRCNEFIAKAEGRKRQCDGRAS